MLDLILREAARTAFDLAPIVLILGLFSARFLARDLALMRRVLIGGLHLAVGLTLFRIGLDGALLPLAGDLARGLAAALVIDPHWPQVLAVTGFAVAIGATAALIEPTLAATADRVRDLSGGTVQPMVLRIAVALGFGLGLGLAGLRLVWGLPLAMVLVPAVALLVLLTALAPRALVPLALDSGAVATSVVTVPIIAAYGVAVAETLPGRSGLADGFGMIVLAMICSGISVLAAAILTEIIRRRASVARDTERGNS
ncbi:DUF1538 family protein [Roseinatronobacter bogoriensis]|uniref:DUF1538 domain-containing protein n=1 Tax=Roseinatronobacter bogoriensis subsp. barguzinensis TaxID=441209 RepID=A0A2K8KBK6_9RHOB|nr:MULTISPECIES: DUF1538 family protein [Rhodobaca]ATX65293.1 DUF1538 domain-containing protein [Rhodobaca barguzinensis]MBB4209410.1 hypothetical protein [Rhodobaca bogoriensis DSM 18756]TDW34531.1 uncharacterized protein DUF1538 [Rhodobaca barguzinensis]TDY67151.1 uncharacterized protein DUF1538 [Rhodobaca bogoriensis DSM 18756]